MFNAEKIAEQLVGVLPQGWTRAVLFANLTSSSYEMFFYTKLDGTYIQCFELCKMSDLTKGDLRKAFRAIYETVKNDQKECGWSVMTFMFESSGKFSTDFVFDNISENPLQYYEKWKDRYLN